MLTEHRFETREAASLAAAERIARLTRERLDGGEASVVVSGGTTPVRCFEALSFEPLDWSSVTVALSDERWVPPGHADSNEGLVRRILLRNEAEAANLLSVYTADLTVDERCDSLQRALPDEGFACALLGMGADGHFASLFPDAESLSAGLDPDSRRFYIAVRTAASPHPRVSMSLGALLLSRELVLLYFGEEKRRIYEHAKRCDGLPVSAMLRQDIVPVSVFWAP